MSKQDVGGQRDAVLIRRWDLLPLAMQRAASGRCWLGINEIPRLAMYVEAMVDWELRADSKTLFEGEQRLRDCRKRASSILWVVPLAADRGRPATAKEAIELGDRLALWLSGLPAGRVFDPELFSDDRTDFVQDRPIAGANAVDALARLYGKSGAERCDGVDKRGLADRAGNVVHDEVSVAGVVAATVGEGPGVVTAPGPGAAQ